MLFSKFITKHQ